MNTVSVPKIFQQHLKSFCAVILAFIVYYLTARLGLELATINKQASPIWPATGVAMGLILIFGHRMAVGIFVGAFLANFETGLNLPATLAIAIGNSLESLFFVWIFNRMLLSQSGYGIHARAIFGIFALVLAAVISATVGTLALWITSVIPLQGINKNWITWWVGDLLGAIFLVPIALKFKSEKFSCFKINQSQIFQMLLLAFITTILIQFIFTSETGKPFLFMIFLSILLAANWLDAAWVYLVSIIICIFFVWQTIQGNGPFSGNILNDNLIHLQIFLGGLGLTAIGLGSLKQEGFNYKSNLALIFGWVLSGMTFYFSYTSTATKDESRFLTKINQSNESIKTRLNDYVLALKSGVSFLNASDYVSQQEWHVFAERLLLTNQYSGIEGIGVLFSYSIKNRFGNGDIQILKYQPKAKFLMIPNVQQDRRVMVPEDHFVITYIEPIATNEAAMNVDISSEKHRYEAALKARDTGMSVMTEEVQLIRDKETRPGFHIYTPVYKTGANIDTVESRRKAHIGFVFAPVIFEKFISSAMGLFEEELSFKLLLARTENQFHEVYTTRDWQSSYGEEKFSNLLIFGRSIKIAWKKGPQFESSTSFVSSWIGFFGAFFSLFLAVLLSSLQNLTFRAQKIAEEMTKELKDRKRTWQALTETSPVGIYLTDKIGNCTYVNSAWSQMTGLTYEEAAGQGWNKALHPEDLNLIMKCWDQLIRGGIFSCNYRFLKSDGSVVYVTGKSIALKDDNQVVIGYFGTVQDITELHQNQMALLTSSRMSSLGQMASGIAHEINNPLAIIQGRALFLEEIIESGKAMDLSKIRVIAKQMTSTVQRISKIIKGLQAFARETSQEPFHKAFLKDALEDTFELCKERFSYYQVQLMVPVDVTPDLCFWGRTEQISQVLLNLLNNSFDAIADSPNKWIKVEVKSDYDTISIYIIDSGTGIASTIQAKLFDPFFTTKDVGKGTGLGLSISKGIMERHKGRIYLDTSKVHTTFVLELPLLRQPKDNDLA